MFELVSRNDVNDLVKKWFFLQNGGCKAPKVDERKFKDYRTWQLNKEDAVDHKWKKLIKDTE